jgi:hypothetical protein
VDDLSLSAEKKQKVEPLLKAHREKVRTLMELARADLLLKMTEVLSDEEFKKFKEGIARLPILPPGPGGPGGAFRGAPGGRGGRGLTVDQIVERILTFDKNKDGKVTKDELPERMQNLIAKGDTNKDGALDKDEIKKLAAELERDGTFRGFGAPGGRGAGARPGRGFPPPAGFAPGAGMERVVADLNLAEPKKEKAEPALRGHQENVRKLQDLAHADLLLKMKEVLSAEEYKKFKETTARPPAPVPDRGARGDLDKKLDQLQKDLDNLRREIRR